MSETLKLELKRVIKANRQRVFEAWTKPELMEKWLAPGAMTVASAVADLKTGGSYRVAMSGDNGSGKCVNVAVEGKYTRIVPNELLSFTWGWPGDPAPETPVTVEFRDVEGGTEVSLTHTGFVDAETLGKHQHGWLGCFDNLATFLEGQHQEDDPNSFVRCVTFRASRERVFDAIATAEGVRGWWTIVSGSGGPDGDLRLEFENLKEYIVLHVGEAKRPSSIRWTCVVHTDLPEWAGTRMTFDLIERAAGACELYFRHIGLTPKLECYEHCEIGWNRFLASVVAYVERGKGTPFGSAALEAKRTA